MRAPATKSRQEARRKIAAGFVVLAVLPLQEAIEQVKNGSPFYVIAQLREIEEKRLSSKIAAGAMVCVTRSVS